MYVYLLKSIRRNWFYVGMSQDPDIRLISHNSGKTKSTKSYRPFKLVYKKEFENRKEARSFEKYLKIRSNKERILKELGFL